MFDGRDILVYDVETTSLKIDEAKIQWFGAYSYMSGEYILIPFKGNEKEIKKLFQNHKILVGFNNKNYDNHIIKNNLKDDDIFEYKVILDFLEISAPKGGKEFGSYRKNRLAQMGIKLKNFTLKNIIEVLKLDTEGTKGDIDYKIFQKDEWTPEEIVEIRTYLKQDIDLTKKLFEWYQLQFSPLMKFLPQKDQDNFLHLKSSLSVLAYNIICNKAGLKPEFGEKTVTQSYPGGHHIEPRWNLVRGNIVEIDFACLHKDTMVITPDGNKKISELNVGDEIRGYDGYEKIAFLNKKKVEKLYKITLESGEVICATPEHKFPIKYIGDKRVDELNVGDDMITLGKKYKKRNGLKIVKNCVVCNKKMLLSPRQLYKKACSKECDYITRNGSGNSNFQNKLHEKKSPICNKSFMSRDCQNRITCGDKTCYNKSKSNNSNIWCKGKTKHDSPVLMKISELKKGIKRTKEIKKNISRGTKIGMRKNWNKYIIAQQNRNKDFFKNPDWILKNQQSRHNNIIKGKWKYKGIRFRSGWEKEFAQLLDYNNIEWTYEPKIFVFKNNMKIIHYIPDFYLINYNLWVEIKGWQSEKSMFKYDLFIKENKSIIITKRENFANEIQKIKNKEY